MPQSVAARRISGPVSVNAAQIDYDIERRGIVLLDPNKLSALVAAHRPGAPAPSFAPIATGKFNTSYWVFSGDEVLVLRIAPPDETVFLFYEKQMMRQEPDIHQRLLAHTTVPVAKIIAFDDSRSLIDRDYLLMERLPGTPWSAASDVDEDRILSQVGAYLAQTHQLKSERFGYLGAHRPMTPQPSWVDAFSVMWNKLIDDIERTGTYDGRESSWLRGLLERHRAIFDRPVASSLLHMDVWQQNILVEPSGDVTGVVDWDRALWGDPEIEFAVLDYCGISKPAFWEGYGKARDWSPEARRRQLFYLLYELQKYIVIRSGRDRNEAWARQYKQQVLDLLRRAGFSPGNGS